MKKKKKEVDNKHKGLGEAILIISAAFILAFLMKAYMAEAYEIVGASMCPTYHNGDRIVIVKIGYNIEHDDVIVFTSPEGPKELIKRVVGLPGQTIRVKDFDLRVIEVTLGPDEYYVMGDNRDVSHDSRAFGPVKESQIQGEVLFRFWKG